MSRQQQVKQVIEECKALEKSMDEFGPTCDVLYGLFVNFFKGWSAEVPRTLSCLAKINEQDTRQATVELVGKSKQATEHFSEMVAILTDAQLKLGMVAQKLRNDFPEPTP